jgi:hypothetical protein
MDIWYFSRVRHVDFMPALFDNLLIAGLLLHFECVSKWEPNASRRETGLLIPSQASRILTRR